MTAWSWAAARRRGTSHVRSGVPCQDAHRTLDVGEDGFVAVVCDGAGSAPHGGLGAAVVARTLAGLAAERLLAGDGPPDEEAAWSWLDVARDRIAVAAGRRGASPRDFAATLVMAVAAGGAATLLLVGDGVAATRRDGTWTVPDWPEHGEYASTTFFVTDDPAPRLRHVPLPARPEALVLMTDGLERLALDFAGRSAHAPFFGAVVGPVERSGAEGRDRRLSASLASFLDSPAINERTDDDKTLVVAVAR